MVDMPCMRYLIKQTGLERKTKRTGGVRIRGQGQPKKQKTMAMSMAQTTPLIRGIFDEVFADQIDASAGSNKSKVWIRVMLSFQIIGWVRGVFRTSVLWVLSVQDFFSTRNFLLGRRLCWCWRQG